MSEKLIIVARDSRGKTVFKGEFIGDWFEADTVTKAMRLVLKSEPDLESLQIEHVLNVKTSMPEVKTLHFQDKTV